MGWKRQHKPERRGNFFANTLDLPKGCISTPPSVPALIIPGLRTSNLD